MPKSEIELLKAIFGDRVKEEGESSMEYPWSADVRVFERWHDTKPVEPMPSHFCEVHGEWKGGKTGRGHRTENGEVYTTNCPWCKKERH